jgi:hypothetical protein
MAPFERGWILGLLAAYVCLAFLMLAVLNPASDMQSQKLIRVYFSASYAVFALWMGRGLTILGSLLTQPTSSARSPAP